jgi:outer membrane protein
MSLFSSIRRHVLALAMAAAVVSPAVSASAADASIAVVNTQEILNKSTAANALKDAANAKMKEFQADLNKKSNALKDEEEELGKQRSVLEQSVWAEKVKKFRQKATDAQRDAQEKKARIDKALGNGFGEIQKAFLDIASKIAKEKGYKVVVTTSALVYADSSLDISAEVLERLNKQLPKVTLKFE